MKVTAIIERGRDGSFGIYLDEDAGKLPFGIIGDGKTIEAAKADFYAAFEDMRRVYAETGEKFPKNIEFDFKYDTASFLQEYTGCLSLAGLQTITGVNQKQLSHYLTGYRKPSEKTVNKIQTAIRRFAEELSNVNLV